MRQPATDARFDFRGGRNSTQSDDGVDLTEFANGRNMRHSESVGALVKRAGSKRLHVTQLEAGAKVIGLHQWTNPAGVNQVVAICNGHFFHKVDADAEFTKIASTFSTTIQPRFMEHRLGAAIILYIAHGTSLAKWDGTALTMTVTGAPDAEDLALYKGRFFAIEDTKRLFYSKVTAPETWGEFADVETFDTKKLVALGVVGSSLALAKQDTIARFTGVDQDAIRIDRETEGIAAQIGVLAKCTVGAVESFLSLLSDRGPYMATEAGAEFIGAKIQADIIGCNHDYLHLAVAAYHRSRREWWLAVPYGTSTVNNRLLAYSFTTQAWDGLWDFQGFNVCSMTRYERSDGTESVMIGGYDGYVRDADVPSAGSKDDVLRDGTLGTAIPGAVTLPDLLFGAPGATKVLAAMQMARMNLGAAGSCTVTWVNEFGDTGTLTLATKGAGVQPYLWRSNARGSRLTLTFAEATATAWEFNGAIHNGLLVGRAAP